MIGDQASDQVAFGHRAWAVDDARIDANQGRSVAHTGIGEAVCRHLRPLVVVGLDRRRMARGREREERRRVEHAHDAGCGGGRQHVLETADVHLVEITRARPPDADERRHVADGVAPVRGACDRGTVADIAGDDRARQAAGRRRSREDDRIVAARRQRPEHGAAEVPGAAGDQHSHDGWWTVLQ